MATAKYFETDGTEKGTRDLPATLFDCKVNEHVMKEAVVSYLANQRQGSASTKERADVRGGSSKPYRQKGTGRARAGTIRSPIWRGGGVTFGPHPRDFSIHLPKKIKRLALKSALTTRAKDGDVLVIGNIEYNEPKTKTFAELLLSLESNGKKVLFVMDYTKETIIKSARNIPYVKVTLGNMLNTYDVLWADKVIITEGAIALMEEVFKE
jgi:large subunit ribosomal protein L4